MARRFLLLALTSWLLLLVLTQAHGQPPRLPAACLLQASASRLHVREATGRNDGPDVALVQRAAGARPNVDPWCGCERFWWNKLCGRPSPAWPAAARNWSRPADARTFYLRGRRGVVDSIKVGDTVTFYYANLGRVGHVGLDVAHSRPIRRGRPTRGFTVRAGNTGRGGGRDGAGVHDVFYPASEIYAASTY